MRNLASVKIACGIGISLLGGFVEYADAQVIPDDTLGAERSEVTPRAAGGLQVEGGAIRGESLFHSFAEFSIDVSEVVYFANPAAIETILGRVTGDVRSDILGTLGVDGNASLYLINPNGIVFGPDAQLDIAGSLFVSTVPSLDLGSGISFSAVEPTTVPLLTISVMPGLPLEQDLSGGIISNGATLSVGDELTLASGMIELEGGLLEANGNLLMRANQLLLCDRALITSEAGSADGGSIIINVDTLSLQGRARVESNSIGTGNAGNLNLTVRYRAIEGDSSISSSAFGEGDAGALVIRASESIAMNSSLIGTAASEGSGNAGNLSITADELFLDEGSVIRSDTLFESTGNAGDLSLNVRRLVMEGDSIISSSTYGEGDGGVLTIRASESIVMGSSSTIQAAALGGSSGDARDFSITADELFLAQGSEIVSDTFSEGDAGNLTINVRQLSLENDSVLTSATEGAGDAGNFSITADELSLIGKSFIASGVFVEGSGNAGDLTIDVRNLTMQGDSVIGSSTFAEGNGGVLTIRASESIVADFSLIEAAAFDGAAGDAGDLNITADRIFLANDSFIAADTFAETTGDAGNLTINVRQLVVENSVISTATDGEGDGGDLTIWALESIELRGQDQFGAPSQILAEVSSDAAGDAGDVAIATGQLLLEDGARVSTSLLGTGQAGSLSIEATETVIIADDSSLEAITTGGGVVGDLSLTTPQLTVQDEGQLLVSSEGNFPAGTLTVNADQIRLSDRASLRAETEAGDEGNITLNAEGILLRNDSSITTSATELATGGRIDINAASFLVLLDRSRIEARATEGQGGNITIATQLFLQGEDSVIDASSDLGVDGTVNFEVLETDVPAEAEALPTTFATASLGQQCDASRSELDKNRFIRTGRGGLPVDVDAVSSAGLWEDHRWSEVGTASALQATQVLPEVMVEPAPSSESVMEAQGWHRTETGLIVLAAEPMAVTPYSALRTVANCQAG